MTDSAMGYGKQGQGQFRVLGGTRLRVLRQLALPASLPSICVALRIAAAHAILAAIVAEYLMGTGGLGFMLADARHDFQMARAIGASMLAIALSVALYVGAYRLEEAVRQRWH